MVDEKYAVVLERLGTADTRHYGASLLEHLEGTYRLLQHWGAREELCLAGLFHSIYGTAYFEKQSADASQRGEIRALIGDAAEELAHLFCMTERSLFFGHDPDAAALSLPHRLTGETQVVSHQTLRDLIEIHVANDLELLPHALGKLDHARISGALDFYERQHAWLSQPACDALLALRAKL